MLKVTLSTAFFQTNLFFFFLGKHEKNLPHFLPVLEDPLPYLPCYFNSLVFFFFCQKRSCFRRINTYSERLPITTRIQAFMRMSNNPFKITQFQTIRSFADLGHQSFLFEKLIALHFALTTDQNCSIGLSSGEYGGK